MDIRVQWLGGLSGGVAVATVGLPSLIALGTLAATPLGPETLASGVVAALMAAIFGHLCATLIARTPGEVSAPDISLSIVYASLCADLVFRSKHSLSAGEVIASLSLAVMMMGAFQVVTGWARLGKALRFLPYPVTAGIVTGTGLLLVWVQLGPLIGLEGRLTHYNWEGLIDGFQPLALLIGAVAALTVWFAPQRFQPLLAGLVGGVILFRVVAVFAGENTAGPALEAVPVLHVAHERFMAFWTRAEPAWLLETSFRVLPYAALLALEGMIELAHTSHAIVEVTGERRDIHRGLIAQGVANMLCGALAALPVAPSHSQSLHAARTGEARTLVPLASAAVLFVVAVPLGRWLAHVPVAVLAGLLFAVGIGLIDHWTRGLVRQAVRQGRAHTEVLWNLAVVAVVAGALFFGGVPVALLVGTMLAMLMLARSLSAVTRFPPEPGARFPSTRIWPAEQTAWLISARRAACVLRPRGGLFFGTAEHLAEQLDELPVSLRYCIIDCSRLTVMDATGCQIVAKGAKKLAARQVTTLLAGLDPENLHDQGLVALGLDIPLLQQRWFRDLDRAMEWVEADLLRERWPEVASNDPVGIGDTLLAKGLSVAEREVLQSCLGVLEIETGKVLFRYATAGEALYVISRGLIEIGVADAQGVPGRRFAVIGPGCIFGEVAMLTRGSRTADAVCIKCAKLYVLRRDTLDELEKQHPAIHTKLITNLNLHLVTRLTATTEIARQR